MLTNDEMKELKSRLGDRKKIHVLQFSFENRDVLLCSETLFCIMLMWCYAARYHFHRSSFPFPAW